MPRKLPPEHSRFKPGQSGNPTGKRKQAFTKEALERVIDEHMFMDRAALQAKLADPTTPMIELMAANIVSRAAVDGDQSRAEWLAMRRIGKVKDQLDITYPTPYVVEWLSGDKTELGLKEKAKELEGSEE